MKLSEIKSVTGDAVNNLTKKELVESVGKLNSIIEKRLQRLQTDDLQYSSPAYYMAKDFGYLEPQRPPEKLTIQQLRREFIHKRNFVMTKTSTVTGSKRNYKKVTGEDFQQEHDLTFDDYIKALLSLKERYASEIERAVLVSEEINNELKKTYKKKGFTDWNSLYEKAIEQIKTTYKDQITDFEKQNKKG